VPAGIPVIQCNRMPQLDMEDHGAKRRLVFVPFEVRLDRLPRGSRRDQRQIEDELRGEEAAVLNWLLDGYLDYRRRGLDVPGRAAELKRSHVAVNDPVGAFLEARCREAPGNRLRKTDLAAAYESWAHEEMAPVLRREDFNRAMFEKGFRTRKTNGGILHWEDLDLA
jgi:putative DNA primase/helicase